MIELTRFNGTKFYLNAELIRVVECTPDTIITLIDDKKIIVKDATPQVIEKILQYRQRVNHSSISTQAGV